MSKEHEFLEESVEKIFIEPHEKIIQINGKVYKLEENIFDIYCRFNFTTKKSVAERTRELAREKGAEFHSFFDNTQCKNCKYNYSVNKGKINCTYTQNNVEEISVFQKTKGFFSKRKKFFMAKRNLCLAEESFYIALLEHGLLDRFIVKGAKPQQYFSIEEVMANKIIEREVEEEYQNLFNREYQKRLSGHL
ncbi:MAG: hypothetical protein QXG86_04050 [Candidatus Woesearchaeota archaeon]